MTDLPSSTVAIIGGGPAGLMAAEVLAGAGVAVDLYDAMPSVGRKFLLAGVGGMNITHSEAYPAFVGRYRERKSEIGTWLQPFDADALCEWIHGLGIDTFVGTSGRVFPTDMKAAPLLRAWLRRLRELGVNIHTRHRWTGWGEAGRLRIAGPDGEFTLAPQATLLALGGASWPRLGSDGTWVAAVADRGLDIAPLRPSNCGFEVERPLGREVRRRAVEECRPEHGWGAAANRRVHTDTRRYRGQPRICAFVTDSANHRARWHCYRAP